MAYNMKEMRIEKFDNANMKICIYIFFIWWNVKD